MQNEKWQKTTNDDTNHNPKGNANAIHTHTQVQRTANVAWQMQLSSNDLIRQAQWHQGAGAGTRDTAGDVDVAKTASN